MNSYCAMDSAALRAAYDNTAVVADFPKLLAEMQEKSEALYQHHTGCQRRIPYGNAQRTNLDYFPANDHKAPLFIFIHGGYWQNCQKEDFAFIAQGPLSLGCHVMLVDYTLAPEADMTQIVDEVGEALDFIDQNSEQFNIDRSKVCLSGHSAGGHLTAMHRAHPLITHAMPISALVDLEPIQFGWLNEALSLTRHEVEAFSPIKFVTKGVPTEVVVGGEELPELLRHSREYSAALKACGNLGGLTEPAGLTHFSILKNDLASPQGQSIKALQALLQM